MVALGACSANIDKNLSMLRSQKSEARSRNPCATTRALPGFRLPRLLNCCGPRATRSGRNPTTSPSGYATPKVDVRAAVFREHRILLVEEREDGGWTLPGGWADVGESPAEATVREVREESGYETRAVKLLAVYARNPPAPPPIPFHAYKLFFQCEPIGGEPASSNETAGVDWFAEDGLPALSTSRVTAAQIHRFFEHYRHPHWPTDFD